MSIRVWQKQRHVPVVRSRIFLALGILGLALRVGFVLAADSRQPTFHSGGSDAPAYILLAENLLAHKGFTYAGQASAFRPPGYPLLLAGFITIFGSHYIAVVRWLQFALGLATVSICAAVSSRLSGKEATDAALLVGLFLPTLVFSTAQVLTECMSAFLTALFLLFLVIQREKGDLRSAGALGLTAGLGSLLRFNAAALPLVAAWTVVQTRPRKSLLWRGAAVLLLPVVIVLPWLVRNDLVFGRWLYSTQGGPNAVQGVVNPECRTQPGDAEKLIGAMGWCVSQLETNDSSRLSLPSEVVLNQRALRVVPRLWKEQGWSAIPLLGRKAAQFWLSTDQLLDTKSFRLSERLTRAGGVLVYLVVLALALGGWFQLHARRPSMASVFLVYAVGLTVLHLPLVMNTRLRIPLMEPLLVILSGAGWVGLLGRARGAYLARVSRSRSALLQPRSESDTRPGCRTC